MASAASTEPTLKTVFSKDVRGGNLKGATALGKTIAQRLQDKGIKRVVFDRGGFLYHGRIKAVADAAREAGREFLDCHHLIGIKRHRRDRAEIG